ncbi:MAG: orotate phosphoribosyltransferase [Armatimonadetes bacterium]|nr:orotate phosphoribosyltransferase [Armatimonadota bacterium]
MSGNQAMLEQLLEESGAILRGHFKLTSGRHSDVYFEKFRVLENPAALSALCREIADRFAGQADIVAGPTTGGIIIAFEVARQMGVSAIYVESEDGVKTLRRNAVIPAGSRVLVVDDVLTTGLSVQETMDAVSRFGGTVAGVGVLIDRSSQSLDFGVPFFAAYQVQAQSWAQDEVPDWLSAIPVAKPGTRSQ